MVMAMQKSVLRSANGRGAAGWTEVRPRDLFPRRGRIGDAGRGNTCPLVGCGSFLVTRQDKILFVELDCEEHPGKEASIPYSKWIPWGGMSAPGERPTGCSWRAPAEHAAKVDFLYMCRMMFVLTRLIIRHTFSPQRVYILKYHEQNARAR